MLAVFSLRLKVFITLIGGVALGMLLSAWQWIPCQLTLKDLVGYSAINSWKIGQVMMDLRISSLSGALGFPQSYLPAGPTHPMYHTVGWWTLPFIFVILLALKQKGKVRLMLSFLIASLFFFGLAFWPFNQYLFAFLPAILNVVQTTSRLIGFVTILSAISFAISVPRIHPRIFCLLITRDVRVNTNLHYKTT